MNVGTDLFIAVEISPDSLRAALARAYGVSIDNVAIRRPGQPWPVTPIIAEFLDNDLVPGDYPTQFLPWGPEDRIDDPSIAASLAATIGAPVLTAANSHDPAEQMLFLPDGSMHSVIVDQDDDDGIRNTAEMRRMIDRARRTPAQAA